METMAISTQANFAEWAIERAKSILTDQGSHLITAAQTGDEARMSEAANAIGQVIMDAPFDES